MKKNYLILFFVFSGLLLSAQGSDYESIKVRTFKKSSADKVSILGEKFYLVNSTNKLKISAGFYHVIDKEAFLVESNYPKDEGYEPAGAKIVYYPKPRKINENYVCWDMEPRICLIYSAYPDNWLDESQFDYLEVFDHQSGVITFILKP